MTEHEANIVTLAVVSLSLLIQGIVKFGLWRYLRAHRTGTAFGDAISNQYLATGIEFVMLALLFSMSLVIPHEYMFLRWMARVIVIIASIVATYRAIAMKRALFELENDE